ncbi:MAG: ArnT family glycosyltransferase [Chthoniobacterales bacterium]
MWRPLFIVLAVWAAIYLPGLGSLEIKGEEGRRILPAITMLETGNYIVPQVGGEPYFRKPPLVNWLVAASFKLTGQRNEWTARLPSVLCILAVALAFISVARATLGANGSLIAALMWLANLGMIEKGRLIEIEALYVSLFGLAIICWLSWWEQRRSRWIVWTVPWLFLGLGWLAKGPLHVFFFYAIVVGVLVAEGQTRQIWNAAHLMGVALMLGIFAAWAVPCLQIMRQSHVAALWGRQLSGRLGGDDFKLSSWLMNIPRGLAYFLPWLVAVPLARRAQLESSRDKNILRGLVGGIAVPFLIVNLMPSALPRYTMPLLVPACIAVATVLRTGNGLWANWVRTPQRRGRVVLGIAIATGVAMCIFALAVVPQLQGREKVKPIAAQIDAAIPVGEPLYAVDPDYQPFLFYTRGPIVYASRLDELPRKARYLLVQSGKEQEVASSELWSPSRPRPVLRLTDYRDRAVVLFEIAQHE